MNLNDVINRFALVSKLTPEEISKWVFVIKDCIQYFESHIKTGELSCEENIRLSHACAVYAYYKYSLYQIPASAEKFKAGDVEFSTSSAPTPSAKAMWEHEKSEISDLVDFGDFCFCRVII